MTYQEFKQNIVQVIQTELGPTIKVIIQEIMKNNDTKLDGMSMLSDQYNMSPTVYLNYCYKQYEEGRSVSDICQEILAAYKANQPTENFDVTFFTDYKKVKNRIIFNLVNYERNQELLSKVPHYRFLDLAIVFACLLDPQTNGYATILIHNHHLKYWNISKEKLYTLSMTNTPKLLVSDLRNMSEVLNGLFKDTDADSIEKDSIPMYVLSNQSKLNGSACILYHNLLENFSKKLDCDLFILPSSVHEVLIIPASKADSFAELSSMVKEVNATQLSREEILSDHAYFFSRETGKLTM